MKGICQKIAWVDLGTGEVKIEEPEKELYLKYLGGYGLGAYYLYKRQPVGTDPLGDQAILGFLAGPLTGTDAITGSRFTVVGKSPKTGGWGDANCGGRWGPALKQAGLDAVFFTGIAEKPVYALVEDSKVTLRDATEFWGMNCGAAEAKFKEVHGKDAHSAVIGPAGERVSALACIINDAGRAAARSGLGMVMGAKRIKGIVAVGSGEVQVAEPDKLKALRKKILSEHYNENSPWYPFFRELGTPGVLIPGMLSGDTPVKNWAGSIDDFESYEKIGHDAVLALQEKRYGCWQCPVSCGGKMTFSSGPYSGTGHQPEYETLGAFGAMCLNDNLESICHLNNISNDAGMDTISAGATVAFAIECFENGLITKEDTGGIELTWGNHEAIVRVTEQMATGDGFGGEVLGNGIRKAVERIGKDSESFAMESGGEEIPMHDPRCGPGWGSVYVADATPGRHTQWGSQNPEGGYMPSEMGCPEVKDPHAYSEKGEAHKYSSSFGHVVNSSGVCQFGSVITPATALPQYLSYAMGEEFTLNDIIEIGERIANLRMAFNLREGVRNKDNFKLPSRISGDPPLKKGPIAGVTIDNDAQVKAYFDAMGWNPDTGVPRRDVLERLGLEFALDVADQD